MTEQHDRQADSLEETINPSDDGVLERTLDTPLKPPVQAPAGSTGPAAEPPKQSAAPVKRPAAKPAGQSAAGKRRGLKPALLGACAVLILFGLWYFGFHQPKVNSAAQEAYSSARSTYAGALETYNSAVDTYHARADEVRAADAPLAACLEQLRAGGLLEADTDEARALRAAAAEAEGLLTGELPVYERRPSLHGPLQGSAETLTREAGRAAADTAELVAAAAELAGLIDGLRVPDHTETIASLHRLEQEAEARMTLQQAQERYGRVRQRYSAALASLNEAIDRRNERAAAYNSAHTDLRSLADEAEGYGDDAALAAVLAESRALLPEELPMLPREEPAYDEIPGEANREDLDARTEGMETAILSFDSTAQALETSVPEPADLTGATERLRLELARARQRAALAEYNEAVEGWNSRAGLRNSRNAALREALSDAGQEDAPEGEAADALRQAREAAEAALMEDVESLPLRPEETFGADPARIEEEAEALRREAGALRSRTDGMELPEYGEALAGLETARQTADEARRSELLDECAACVGAWNQRTLDVNEARADIAAEAAAIRATGLLEHEAADPETAQILREALDEAEGYTPLEAELAPGLYDESVPGRTAELRERLETTPVPDAEAEKDRLHSLAQTVMAPIRLVHPDADFVAARLSEAAEITGTEAAVPGRDPLGKLNQPDGYTACVFFSAYDLLREGQDLLETGIRSGGVVEVYPGAAEAEARAQALADQGAFSGSTQSVLGSMVIRLSSELSEDRRVQLLAGITAAMTRPEEGRLFAERTETAPEPAAAPSAQEQPVPEGSSVTGQFSYRVWDGWTHRDAQDQTNPTDFYDRRELDNPDDYFLMAQQHDVSRYSFMGRSFIYNIAADRVAGEWGVTPEKHEETIGGRDVMRFSAVYEGKQVGGFLYIHSGKMLVIMIMDSELTAEEIGALVTEIGETVRP